ncbi:hypothetical protein CR513_44497, partial [Mucuna pruriens]
MSFKDKVIGQQSTPKQVGNLIQEGMMKLELEGSNKISKGAAASSDALCHGWIMLGDFNEITKPFEVQGFVFKLHERPIETLTRLFAMVGRN